MAKGKFHQYLISTLAVLGAMAISLSGCSQLSEMSGGLIPGTKGPLTGDWQLGYQQGEQVIRSKMHIDQKGDKFVGTGKEDETGRGFKIAGTMTDNQLSFSKSYLEPNPNEINLVVTYSGNLQMLNDPDYKGPYLTGQYSASSQSGSLTGDWEAQLINPPAGSAQTPQPSGEGPPDMGDTTAGAKAPDLSGKWDIAFRHNFKIIKSTMYLEQDGGHLRGHGIDRNTNEKFVIVKGWYNYPKLTIVRKYIKGKDAGSSRVWTFKGEVSMVKDADYQGPYLKGEFEGGGDWEGQQVK